MAWLGTWKHRVKLTIDAGDIDADLTNFPVLVHISASCGINSEDISFVFDELTSDANRKKIAVTTSDGTTECKVEIEFWDDANEQAWLWVKVPSIDDINNTDLYLYYDHLQADNDTNVGDVGSTPAKAVWDSNFKAVYHFNETSTPSKDSLGVTDLGWVGTTASVAGKASKGNIFDGDSDYENKANCPFGLTTAFTIELWVKPADLNDTNRYIMMIAKQGAGTTNQLSIIWEFVNNQVELYVVGQTGDNLRTGSGMTLTAAWRHVTYTYDGVTLRGYVDGAEIFNSAKSTTLPTLDAITLIGCGVNLGGPTYVNFFKGSVDETRWSNIGRSASYVKATYETGRDHLLDWGTEETNIKNATLTVTELVGLYDPVSTKARGYFKTITELVGLKDSKSRIVGKVRSVTELLGSKDLTTTKVRSYFKTKIVTEIVGLKDTFTKIRTGTHSLTITEIMGFLDTISFPRKPQAPMFGKIMPQMDKFLGWLTQLANPKIRGDVKIDFGETEHTYGSLRVYYQTTVGIRGKVAEAFAETMPVTASLIQDFTETIYVKSSVMQTFTETINVCADLMKAVWFDGKLKVKSKLTTLKDYLEGLIQKIKETEETPEEKIDDMRDELEEKEDDSN